MFSAHNFTNYFTNINWFVNHQLDFSLHIFSSKVYIFWDHSQFDLIFPHYNVFGLIVHEVESTKVSSHRSNIQGMNINRGRGVARGSKKRKQTIQPHFLCSSLSLVLWNVESGYVSLRLSLSFFPITYVKQRTNEEIRLWNVCIYSIPFSLYLNIWWIKYTNILRWRSEGMYFI